MNTKEKFQQLEKAKARLVEICDSKEISVVRYNFAREELKKEFPVEIISMLDASGFIKAILSEKEKEWMKERRAR